MELEEAFFTTTSLPKSLELKGGPYPMPLASDPANLLGDSIDLAVDRLTLDFEDDGNDTWYVWIIWFEAAAGGTS